LFGGKARIEGDSDYGVKWRLLDFRVSGFEGNEI
jgi:hypothetical protein